MDNFKNFMLQILDRYEDTHHTQEVLQSYFSYYNLKVKVH